MRLNSKILIFSYMLLFCQNSWSFDRLYCDSNLQNWSLHSSFNSSGVLLNDLQRSATFNPTTSAGLIVKDHKGTTIASILPWNGVVLLKDKTAVKKSYTFVFDKKDDEWFSLRIQEPGSSVDHEVTCRFSF